MVETVGQPIQPTGVGVQFRGALAGFRQAGASIGTVSPNKLLSTIDQLSQELRAGS